MAAGPRGARPWLDGFSWFDPGRELRAVDGEFEGGIGDQLVYVVDGELR